MVDPSGNVVERYAYTPYGTRTVFTASWTELTATAYNNTVSYTGQRLDAESNLHHFRNRYYSADLGRFITRDPLGYVDGMSLYGGYFAAGFAIDAFGLQGLLPVLSPSPATQPDPREELERAYDLLTDLGDYLANFASDVASGFGLDLPDTVSGIGKRFEFDPRLRGSRARDAATGKIISKDEVRGRIGEDKPASQRPRTDGSGAGRGLSRPSGVSIASRAAGALASELDSTVQGIKQFRKGSPCGDWKIKTKEALDLAGKGDCSACSVIVDGIHSGVSNVPAGGCYEDLLTKTGSSAMNATKFIKFAEKIHQGCVACCSK